MKIMKSITRNLRILLMVVFFILIVIHFIFKDRFPIVSVIYYACPLPLIIIFGLFITLLFFKQKRLFYSLVTILFAISIYFLNHYFVKPKDDTQSGETSKILFWNVAKNQPLPANILIKHIRESKPEIVALVEALDVSDNDLKILRLTFPEYQFQPLEGEMLLAVKGTIGNVVFDSESDVYKYNYVQAKIENQSISILIADVYASPLLNKEIPLNIIIETAKKEKVDVLVGDFNTPYESVFFEEYKIDFKSFHPYSIGMSATWPIPIPVIEIDQVWVAKSLQPIKMEKFSYNVSDHKLLIAEYR